MAAQLTDASGLAAFGLTEPEPAPMPEAPDQGHPGERTWTINGSKCFITNSGTDITRSSPPPP